MTNLDGYMAKRETEKRWEEFDENKYHDTASVPISSAVEGLLEKDSLSQEESDLLYFLL